jgi:UDP-N-acetylglucosamine 4,6-dehydratase/5-epimerase
MNDYLILGGCGSLGSELIRKLYSTKCTITVFSRDEYKQSMQKKLFPKVNYIIGDIRDKDAIREASRNKFAVFHCAALKHVDLLETAPMEAVKTNILGTVNAAEAAIENNVKYFAFCNTDKAILPLNCYGFSKALASKILLDLNRKQRVTAFSVYVWGNVAASRGSVIAAFVDTLKREKKIFLTDRRMSRAWLTLDFVSDYLLSTYQDAKKDAHMIPNMKGALVIRVAAMIAKIMGINDYQVIETGLREGEKIVETLYTSHSLCLRTDTIGQYEDWELEELLEPIVRRLL